MRRTLAAAAVLVSLGGAGAAGAQDSVLIADVIELSGGGATVGTNWKNGVDLAASRINAEGGILGRKVVVEHYDTQSNPAVSKAVLQKALDEDPFVVLGPIYSSSTKVNMVVTQRAEVPQIVGSEASDITEQGNPWVFRTSFGQAAGMPKLANYMRDGLGARTVDIVWVNNDFGKGGRDAMVAELNERGIEVGADLSTEVQQVDFAPDVVQVRNSGADAVFVYLHEEESARFLKELRKQGYERPVIGETTLMNQKVIDLAGEAVEGVRGHVGLSADAPLESVAAMAEAYEKTFGAKTDHNGIKGYIALHIVKAIAERTGGFDRAAFGEALRGATITTADEPGVLMDVTFDEKGDIDRESFLVEVENGQQVITEVLPKLGS